MGGGGFNNLPKYQLRGFPLLKRKRYKIMHVQTSNITSD